MRCLHLRCAAFEKVCRSQTPDRRIRETKVKTLEVGPLHNNLEKGFK
jgi:hypothetical protein